MDADELQACLTATGIAGTFRPFSKETCVIMINMLDESGKLGYPEFTELLQVLEMWMVRTRILEPAILLRGSPLSGDR